MVELHFRGYLNKEKIEQIKTENAFRDSLPLEKFIMDFEVLIHIQEVLPDCIVKGGMAVPFHIQDKTLRRLSVDIDIVTGSSREEVIEAMKKVSEKLKGIVTIKEPHIPKPTTKNKNKKLPLLTYYCEYKSSIDENPEMKIEIFYGNKMEIKSKKIDDQIEIIGFLVDFPISIYEHGSLIGDKLTTLPFNTIGIDPNREIDVPKQIYDIGTLLRSISGKSLMEEIIDAFEKISSDEISYFIENKPSFNLVLEDLNSFSDQMLVTDNQIKLNKSYEGRFDKFTIEMLGKTRYPSYVHVTDILLIKVVTKIIIKKLENKMNLDTASRKLTEILDSLGAISKSEPKEKFRLVRQYVGKHGKDSSDGKIIKNLLAEQAYLYDQLLEIEKI